MRGVWGWSQQSALAGGNTKVGASAAVWRSVIEVCALVAMILWMDRRTCEMIEKNSCERNEGGECQGRGSGSPGSAATEAKVPPSLDRERHGAINVNLLSSIAFETDPIPPSVPSSDTPVIYERSPCIQDHLYLIALYPISYPSMACTSFAK